jgi:ADP-glucose pyrophosphorylase
MKSQPQTDTRTVKESVEQGMEICLPNILDEFLALTGDGVYRDIAFSIVSTHLATEHDITMKQAQDVAKFTFDKLGVEI